MQENNTSDWTPILKQHVSLPYLVIAIAAVLIDEQRRLPAVHHAQVSQ